MKAKTMGQAVDEALTRHAYLYLQSAVVQVTVQQYKFNADLWEVELRVTGRSDPARYFVNMNE